MVDKNTLFGGMLTTLGAAKKTNCDALGIPWEPSHMLIGDANGADPVPAPAQTRLINPVHRAPLNQLRVSPTDPNVLIAEVVLPPEVGGWWMRELALEDKDGVFSAVANLAPSYKPLLGQGSGRNQVVRMHIITNGTANIQLKIDPSVVLATRDFVDRSIRDAYSRPYILIREGKSLSSEHMGLVLCDASNGAVTLELPPSDSKLTRREILIRRKDHSGHRLVVQAHGSDRILFHTHLSQNGYPFLPLMGTGDWWHLCADGRGHWWPLGRLDTLPLGHPVFETTTRFSPGGYAALNGRTFERSEWPWLWDHAQQSGMLNTEQHSIGDEGGWIAQDDGLTFRGPEGRGEFLRILDESRNVDAGRNPGSWQKGSRQTYDAGGDGMTALATGLTQNVLERALAIHGFDVGEVASYRDSMLAGETTEFLDREPISPVATARPRNIAYPGRIKII